MTEPAIQNTKICGITQLRTAELCVGLGFGAVGFVFHQESPRNISAAAAGEITKRLPSSVARVGVFVDKAVGYMLETALTAGLSAIQLHGNEDAATIQSLQHAGYKVVKVVKSTDGNAHKLVESLPPGTSILLECGKGVLPGGNGAAWDWAAARAFATGLPLGIAGGLNASNIVKAIEVSGAIAYDISSGVESSPGVKDETAIMQLANQLEDVHLSLRPFWKQNEETTTPFSPTV